MTTEELTERARQIVDELGGQSAAARAIGVSQPSVWKAVNGKPGYEQVCLKILRHGGYEVVMEPRYKIKAPRRRRAANNNSPASP